MRNCHLEGTCYRFKYVPARRLNQILNTEKIHFTRPKSFNDPFEELDYLPPRDRIAYEKRIQQMLERVKLGVDYLHDGYEVWKEQLNDLLGKPTKELPFEASSFILNWSNRLDEHRRIKRGYPIESLDAWEKRWATLQKNKYDEKYVILSLAARKDSLLMWSHYADEHKGAVIEFDIHNKEFSTAPIIGKPYKTVEFFDEEGQKRGTQMAEDVTYRESNIRPLLVPTEPILMRHFFEKSSQWQYENESRIIRLRRDSEQKDQLETGALFPLPLAAIKTIILGQRFCENEDIGASHEQSDSADKWEKICKICKSESRNGIETSDSQEKLQMIADVIKQEPAEWSNIDWVKKQIDEVNKNSKLAHVDIYTAHVSDTHFELEFQEERLGKAKDKLNKPPFL